MAARTDIDRLIELGLNRYGAGDLDGALLLWEEALAIDPDNAQASSYVDYVRDNYELLTSGEPSIDEEAPPFGIEEEPEYHIEIEPARPSSPAMAPVTIDPLDGGWDLEETYDASAASDAVTTSTAPAPARDDDDEYSVELEAEEPPPPSHPSDNFEDATREFHGVAAKSDFTNDPAHGDFQQEEPSGFHSQGTTGVRKRDLGFVRPGGVVHVPPKIEIPPKRDTSSGSIELGQYEATQERPTQYRQEPEPEPNEFDDDLIGSLPTPTPPGEPESGEIRLPGKKSTRDMPHVSRAPARRDSEDMS